MVAVLAPQPADLVVEIGAGAGALTAHLAGRAGRVLALEVDPALFAELAARAARWPGVEPRLVDARTFPYETLRAARPDPAGRVLVTGNLPYSAAKAILARLLAAHAALDRLVVMLQREVAERLVAAPGGRAYGALSVLWQLWADLQLVRLVPPGAFRPPPEVDSAVVAGTFRAEPRAPVPHPALFERVVRAGFGRRRKTLLNALRGGALPGGPDGPARALAAAGLDGRRRAETLTVAEFAALARSFAALEGA